MTKQEFEKLESCIKSIVADAKLIGRYNEDKGIVKACTDSIEFHKSEIINLFDERQEETE